MRKLRGKEDKSNVKVNLVVLMHKRKTRASGSSREDVGRLWELLAETIAAVGAPVNGSKMMGAPSWVNICNGSTQEGEQNGGSSCPVGRSTRAVEAPRRELPGHWWEHPDGNMMGASVPAFGSTQ
ncbi:hypothetical protein FB451DRAFT_1169861 [Mycena latifolia]|nr:hypothetical protein FB451DRAFT_1169861 [Mycena latifolia]